MNVFFGIGRLTADPIIGVRLLNSGLKFSLRS